MDQQDGEQQQQQQQGVVQVQPQLDAPVAPAAPLQCPRCNSRNTKFCYYNNYSFSQPRHLCKTCRRYWTHGGTLRNVPVGGGSRKGERPKTSSSSSSTSSDNSQPLQKLVAENHLAPTATFYQGGGSGVGGYLASLAALNQLNNPSMNYPFDPSLINLGGVGGAGGAGGAGGSGSSSNLGIFQAFNATDFLGSSSSSASQRQNIPQQQFFQLGNGEFVSLYNNSEQGLINNIPSTMANNNYTTSAASMLQTQSFMNGAAATSNSNDIRALSDASLWSTISTTNYIGGANINASTSAASGASDAGADAGAGGSGARAGGSNSLAPNQWFDLNRYQPPPQ